MSKSVFKLKQFEVSHSQSSMKVGTDAMILGAIASNNSTTKILDIGTGCGILALMMAQKYPQAQILGIDIHKNSIQEAKENFNHSRFTNLNTKEISLQEFSKTNHDLFDLIISNPPFFDQDLKSQSSNRNFARHNDNLSFEELIESAKNLLNPKGKFWFILPERYDQEIQKLILASKLHLVEKVNLTNDSKTTPVRIIYSISKIEMKLKEWTLNIRVNSQYSDAYKKLTSDFHFNLL